MCMFVSMCGRGERGYVCLECKGVLNEIHLLKPAFLQSNLELYRWKQNEKFIR